MSLRPQIILPRAELSVSPKDLPPTDSTAPSTKTCRTGPDTSYTDLCCIDASVPCPLRPCTLRDAPVTVPLTFADVVAHLQAHHIVAILPIPASYVGGVPSEWEWACVWPECGAVLAVDLGDMSGVLGHLWVHYCCESEGEGDDDDDCAYDDEYGYGCVPEQEQGFALPTPTPTPTSRKICVYEPSPAVKMYKRSAEASDVYAPTPVRGQIVAVHELEHAARSTCRPAAEPVPPPPLPPSPTPRPRPSKILALLDKGLLEKAPRTMDTVVPSDANADRDAYSSTPDSDSGVYACSDADAELVTCHLCGPHMRIRKDHILILAHLQQAHRIDPATYPPARAPKWTQWACTWPLCFAQVHPAVGNIVRHVLWHMEVACCGLVELPRAESEIKRAVAQVTKSSKGNVGARDGAWGSWRRGAAVQW